MWMRNFWKNAIDHIWNFHPIRGQTYLMFHLKTSNLDTSHQTNMNTRPYVLVTSMHFVFPFCPYVVISISKQTWETEATHFTDFSRFFPLRVHSFSDWTSAEHRWEISNEKFTLRNLIKLPSLLDRGLAEFVFPNITLIGYYDDTCLCCKLSLVSNSSLGSTKYFEGPVDTIWWHPALKTGEIDLHVILTTNIDDFTFLSCGDTYKDSPNVLALFMPYTKTTWGLIFFTIFGWPLVLSLIENEFEFKKVLRDFEALFIGWAMILEQSHFRATNYKGRGPLYCYCGCVLLALLILSNAYKGDNIKALTKAFELIPLTHMDQVIKAGYKTYTRQFCLLVCRNDFDEGKNGRRNQYTDEQLKLWEPMGLQRTTFYLAQVEVDFFGKCREKKALLGWRSVLEPLQKQLRKSHVKTNAYLGQEFIYTRRVGWQLKRYASVKVLKRMWSLVESGVHSELLNISYKPMPDNIFEPRPLTIHGNIFVHFVIHLVLLLFALLVFVIELHKRIALCFNSVLLMSDLLIRNVLYQWQKVFLLGLRFLLKTRTELFHCNLSSLH